MTIVETAYGKVRGAQVGGVVVFKGIRYGSPTGGANRFKPPRKPAAWSGILDAAEFGDTCPQDVPRPAPDSLTAALIAEITRADDSALRQGEDCLVLNVWTPEASPQRKRPVMVWLHGGAFNRGTGSSAVYDGARLAEAGDTVIVTLNHRLGVFGFLHLEEYGGEAFAASGNAGMLDIVEALHWVREHIADFGGDPANVTVFGESGGGGKVCALLSMPAAKGLFHRAIVQSGPFPRGNTRQFADQAARTLLADLGVSAGPLEALQSIDAARLVAASVTTEAKIKSGRLIDGSMGCWAPVTDGAVLPYDPVDPLACAIAPDVPLMIGTTKDELTFTLFGAVPDYGSISEDQEVALCRAMTGSTMDDARRLYRDLAPGEPPSYRLATLLTDLGLRYPTTLLAERRATYARAPVYLYVLTWGSPALGGILRSPHTLDIPLIFGTFDSMRAFVGDGPDLDIVARQMSATWLAFARNGTPGNAEIPSWPAYDDTRRPTMILDVESRVVDDYDGLARRYWREHA